MQTFVEVPFLFGDAKVFPDGLIRVERGRRTWTALVEVKTGTNLLQTPQLETYLDVAKEQGFDALLTISNEIPAIAGQHPTRIDKRKLRKVALHHYSWTQVLSQALMQKEHRGVADPDQAWVLGELIRYLEHPRSGAMEFDDMGASWVPTRESVTAGTLRAGDSGAVDVAARFDALLRYASLRLGRQLGTDVVPHLARRDVADPAARTQGAAARLAESSTLEGAIRIPRAVAPLVVTVDVRAGTITCHVDLEAPREGRPTTRVNWLVRQLRGAPESVRLEATVRHERGQGAAALLREVRETPQLLVRDASKELRSFRVAMTTPMGTKRGRGRGSFIDSVLKAIDTFYSDVLQHLKAWIQAPPRLREPAETPPVTPASLVGTAQSSQDGTDPVDESSTHPAETQPGQNDPN